VCVCVYTCNCTQCDPEDMTADEEANANAAEAMVCFEQNREDIAVSQRGSPDTSACIPSHIHPFVPTTRAHASIHTRTSIPTPMLTHHVRSREVRPSFPKPLVFPWYPVDSTPPPSTQVTTTNAKSTTRNPSPPPHTHPHIPPQIGRERESRFLVQVLQHVE
jgi:hypothetical protein